ncbi:GAF domain-containing protein [Veronia nyctiphanis]|uniref:GAF domain-containing protein n=1 Tax=Veronia nyctiphanis TaxID=1278244 RepID=A0A4Q0YYW1_9GAMM|nr:GAF domain-containing protein [Veronia nyctiphanis]RXJ74291.1 GAF domain-containing protein [Veronia nyctiphanis]
MNNKPDFYALLTRQMIALIEDESNRIANLSNVSALLFQELALINWAGFYLFESESEQLVLGPFQGKPACVRIGIGKGVCGTSFEKQKTVLVEDVHAYPGHIACDAASNSEIVLPLMVDNVCIGVLDIDSPQIGRFDKEDAQGLEMLVNELQKHL